MVNTINLKDMRNLNLFGKITHVDTRHCFDYNDALVFCVPKHKISRAVGENGKNVRKMSEIINKKIKIIPIPNGLEHAKEFIQTIVSPITFKDLEIKDNEIILTAGSQNKATLFGRNKRRLHEMQKIVKSFFGKEFRIV